MKKMNSKTKNTIITTIGLILMAIGYFFLSSAYTLIIGIPIFIVGLSIIWIAKKSLKFKLLCTALPIILYIPYNKLVFHLYKNSRGQETKIDLIIDEDFYGKIVIINNLNCQKPHKINKRTEIVVPENGITHYNGEPLIDRIYTRVLERNQKGETKELNWHELSDGEKGITSEGQNGIVYEGQSYKVNVVEIEEEIQLKLGINDLEEEIIKYIKDCKKEHY